ncbi:MAG: DUF4153 domain-containing protein [Erysipelotrichaceae bacterium]|nr:DUF4153 domain-containing protein [Erysipelotrichaceae bacterium]
MNAILERIKKATGRLEESAKRFPFSFGVFCLITLVGIYQILAEEEAMELFFALCIGSLLCFLFELSYEYGIHRIRILIPAVALISTVISYLLMNHYDNAYVYTGLSAVALAAVSLAFGVLYKDRETRHLFSHLLKTSFIVEVFAGVIISGFSVCITAFHFLIFDFNDIWKLFAILFLLVNGLFSIMLFLSYVPLPGEDPEVPSVYRVIIHKALFYIYLVLIGILYLYILKIIVTFKMPVGQLNWFGCFALLFYVFFYLSVDEKDGKYQKLFKQYGAYLLVPVLAIQLFAIIIRLNAYGLTTARLMSLILIVIAVGFMICQIFHFKVSYCFIFTAFMAILFTCTPLNIYDIPNRSQENRLKNALIKGGALVDGKLNDQVEMEAQYLEDVYSAYDYLRYSYGEKSEFFEQFSESKIAESLYGYNNYNRDTRSFYYNNDLEDLEFDISKYSVLRRISSEGDTYDKEIRAFLSSLDTENGSYDYLEYEFKDGNKIIFQYVSFEYDDQAEVFERLYWNGILLSH